jgi:hypothetical protein
MEKLKYMSYTYLKANIYSNNLENLRKNKGKITEWQLVNEKGKEKNGCKMFFRNPSYPGSPTFLEKKY